MRIGLGIGLNRFRGAGAAITGLLDQYTGAAAAFSLDTLIYGDHSVEDTAVGSQTNGSTDTYTVRVRRSSDNAVRSFTHTEVGNGTLVTWVGAGNDGFVEAWYNQGSESDAVQTTAANQPKIVDAGSLVVENGKAGIDFLGESSIFLDTGDFALISQPVTTFAVIADEKQRDTFRLIHSGKNSNKLDLGISDNGSLYGYSTQLGISSKNFNNQQAIAYLLANGASSQLNKNNETPEIENIGSSGTQVESLRIGIAQFIAFSFQGLMQALLFFPSDQSTNRTAIESALNDYYEIY
jgi:hypothetical protein